MWPTDGVVHHQALDAVTQGREQEALLDALLVHHVEAHVTVAVRAGQRLELAVLGLGELPVGVAALALLEILQPLVERAGLGDRVERRVPGSVGDAVPEDQLAPLALLDPPDEALDILVAVTK